MYVGSFESSWQLDFALVPSAMNATSANKNRLAAIIRGIWEHTHSANDSVISFFTKNQGASASEPDEEQDESLAGKVI